MASENCVNIWDRLRDHISKSHQLIVEYYQHEIESVLKTREIFSCVAGCLAGVMPIVRIVAEYVGTPTPTPSELLKILVLFINEDEKRHIQKEKKKKKKKKINKCSIKNSTP